MRPIAAFVLLIAMIAGVGADPPPGDDEAAIREVIATWYRELQKGTGRRHWRLYAPMPIDGGPGERELFPGKRSLGPTASNELAAQALRFAYEIDVLKIDPNFAKAVVWERGYFYAWANKETYEAAAHAVFVLEKQPGGRWLILAHESNRTGIPPNKRTEPLPDMKPLWEARGSGPAEETPGTPSPGAP